MAGMKYSELWTHGCRFYEQIKAMDEISKDRSWAQRYKCCEQL